MTLTESGKKCTLNRVIKTLKNISDKSYLERVWIKGLGTEVDDFDETCNFFFNDFRAIRDNWKGFGITEEQFHSLKQFYDEFKQYSDNEYREPIEFIDTPEWKKIMERAKEVLKAFNYTKT